jgi:hypothetical protein
VIKRNRDFCFFTSRWSRDKRFQYSTDRSINPMTYAFTNNIKLSMLKGGQNGSAWVGSVWATCGT